MKKKFKLDYHTGGDVIEIIIRDITGAKIDTFKCNFKNFPDIIRIISRKYGLKFEYKKDDLGWLKDN